MRAQQGGLCKLGGPQLVSIWVDSSCLGPVLLCYGSPSKLRQKTFWICPICLIFFYGLHFWCYSKTLLLKPIAKDFLLYFIWKVLQLYLDLFHDIWFYFLSKVLGCSILFGFACQSLTVLILLTKKTTPTPWSRISLYVCGFISTIYMNPLCCDDSSLMTESCFDSSNFFRIVWLY